MKDIDIKNLNKKKTEVDTKKDQRLTSSIKYAESPFFKKKDQEAISFLEKHPIPNTFWE